MDCVRTSYYRMEYIDAMKNVCVVECSRRQDMQSVFYMYDVLYIDSDAATLYLQRPSPSKLFVTAIAINAIINTMLNAAIKGLRHRFFSSTAIAINATIKAFNYFLLLRRTFEDVDLWSALPTHVGNGVFMPTPREWRAMLSTQEFERAHCSRSMVPSSQRTLFVRESNCSVYPMDFETGDSCQPDIIPFPLHVELKGVAILAHLDGLLCVCLHQTSELVL
ncbi:hypothetical protein L1987_49702 [Smallanthus sonchifolius]|uniref:Uncharacterized protein n=1 Tax=Smallanthus sonchifolius TaxID=185202 RepID=A0ACB9FUU3_9ASTR|nr:hypothetical protein L1987_49702 [Smallanthus sonchifolius]